MLIVGGSYIGVEIGSIYSRFGSKVTIVEALPQICPLFDKEISAQLCTQLKKQGLTIFTSHRVEEIQNHGEYAEVLIKSEGN